MNRTTPLAVAVLSAAVLGYEVLLVRLFSILSWQQFAAMIISIALLGFGASGTVLALAQEWLVPRFRAVFAGAAILFAVAAVGCFALTMRVPFNPLALVWDPWQPVWLWLGSLLLVLPFFFGGGAIGLALTRYRREAARIYAFDLAGAGIGALGVIGALFLLSPEGTLRLVAALGLVSAALVVLTAAGRIAGVATAGLVAVAVLVALWLPPGLTALVPHVSEFKGLPVALRVPDARIVSERSSPIGLLHVVESPTIPFRHAPGLSLVNPIEPPAQLGLFTDADGQSAITRFDGDLSRLAYLDFTTSALPYHLLDDPEVLVLGAGGGEQVLLALYHRVPRIDALELNSQVVDLVAREHAAFAGGIYDRREVTVKIGEARSFVQRTQTQYDLIQIPSLSSFGAAASGAQSAAESYRYTVEAMRDYLGRLKPGGILSITVWLKLPPRDSLRLFATAIKALDAAGIAEPGRQLALIRSWKTATLLVRKGVFPDGEIAALKAFTQARAFDLAWYPGMHSAEANRYTVLARPYLYEGAAALAGPGADRFIERYKFDISPTSDDRPFFFDFFRWRSLPELLRLRAQGTAVMLDMSYPVLFATLLQAAVLSALLILAPLGLRRRRLGDGAPAVTGYFTAIGIGFLLIEIAWIHRFVLFLGHPIYAVAVVLAGFLVFAGAGSAAAPRLDRWLRSRPRPYFGALDVAVVGIGVLTLCYLAVLPPVFDALITLPDPARIAVSLGLIAPLACLMGMPFPLGLITLAQTRPELVPWAWGINGCASVVAAVLATLLAIHLGFAAVMLVAVGLYLAALVSGRYMRRDGLA